MTLTRSVVNGTAFTQKGVLVLCSWTATGLLYAVVGCPTCLAAGMVHLHPEDLLSAVSLVEDCKGSLPSRL